MLDAVSEHPPEESERYAAVRQYSIAQILGVWAAAAIPMGVLAWIVAPLLRDQLGGDEPFAQALLICLIHLATAQRMAALKMQTYDEKLLKWNGKLGFPVEEPATEQTVLDTGNV